MDPIKIDASKPVVKRKQFSAEILLWFVPYVILPLAAGLIGFGCVMYGDGANWLDFNGRSGFWGTHYLDGFLYSLGNYHLALLVVGIIWFSYGALAVLLLTTVIEGVAHKLLGH